MTESNNIFSNPPSMTSDEALADLREKLTHGTTSKENFYCATHLAMKVDALPHVNFKVGSVNRYSATQFCKICANAAQFVVVM